MSPEAPVMDERMPAETPVVDERMPAEAPVIAEMTPHRPMIHPGVMVRLTMASHVVHAGMAGLPVLAAALGVGGFGRNGKHGQRRRCNQEATHIGYSLWASRVGTRARNERAGRRVA